MENRSKGSRRNWRWIGFSVLALISLWPKVNGPMALLTGFLFTYFFGHPFAKQSEKTISWLLKIAVVGLGFGIHVQEAMTAGKEGFWFTLMGIVLTLVMGYFLGKGIGLNWRMTHLISSGTAICGGSAIAAVAPTIHAKAREISVALGVVFLLNSIALIVYPPIGHAFDLTQRQFGIWSAVAIHDTSSVVGAALTYGNEALKVATTVKLARALWIIPLALFSVIWFKGSGKKIKVPWFILLFMVAILANSYLPMPVALPPMITLTSKSLLVLTLFLIGASLSVENIRAAGWKPMFLGLILWLLVSTVSLAMIATT